MNLRTIEKNKAVVWRCLCDCGKEVFVRSVSFSSGHTASCGCLKKELDKDRSFEKFLTYKDDTCIEFVENISKIRTNTSPDTGVRGVVLRQGKSAAGIAFRKKHYNLGTYSRLEDAVKSRKNAEEKIKEYMNVSLETLEED